MEIKPDMNSNQEPLNKKTSNNFIINDDLKENNISDANMIAEGIIKIISGYGKD